MKEWSIRNETSIPSMPIPNVASAVSDRTAIFISCLREKPPDKSCRFKRSMQHSSGRLIQQWNTGETDFWGCI